MNKAIKKFLAFIFLFFIVTVALILVYNFSKPYFAARYGQNETNKTIVQNITHIHETTVLPGKSNLWDFLWKSIAVVALFAFLSILAIQIFKFMSGRRAFSQKNWELCVKKAVKHLGNVGFTVGGKENMPKQSYRFYGVDNESNPAWAFLFIRDGVDYTKNWLLKSDIISCIVDAKTFEVFNEQVGKDLDDLKQEFHEQRFGRLGVPNWAGKTEKPPSFEDLFAFGKPSLTISPEEETK